MNLELKLGFDRIRSMIADRCSTDYASGRVRKSSPHLRTPSAGGWSLLMRCAS